MKRKFFLSFVTLLLIYAFKSVLPSEIIDKNSLSESSKKKMAPFKYDSQKFTKIIFAKKVQQLEVEVPVFSQEDYRIVFNLAAMPENTPIGISIHTKPKEFGKREAIFTNKDALVGTKEFVFDVPRVHKLFVDYDIPATDDALTGYILFMTGYK